MIKDLGPKSPARQIETPTSNVSTWAVDRIARARLASRTPFHCRIAAPMIAGLMRLAVAHAGLPVPVCAQEVKAKQPVQMAMDAAATRSLLAVHRLVEERNVPSIVVLGRPSYARDIPEYSANVRLDMLARELVRQSILIAARDELGLSTHDDVIDDVRVDGTVAADGEAEVISFIRDHRWRIDVRKVSGDRTDELFSGETQSGTGPDLDSVGLIVAAEARSRHGFPKIFNDMGLTGKPNDFKETTEPALPRDTERRLSTLGYSQTLAAVRDLHQAIRTIGETPVALGALVRGYAQLAVLSEFHWHPAHRVFKARSLLYAQRMLARRPDSPLSLWHRAFALALAGRHRDALADLESAKKLAGAEKNAPVWLDLIDAYARCDTRRMQGQKAPVDKLAGLLRMITLEYPAGNAINVTTSRLVLSLDPLCFRAVDVMCQGQGVSTLHVATRFGPQVLEQLFAQDLATVESLPADLRDRINEKLTVRELTGLLQTAGRPDRDRSELSWGVLAHLIRETQFVQVWRRLVFMKNKWSVPVDEYWNDVNADVATHRYRPYLETLALPAQVSVPAFQRFADRFDLSDVELTADAMIAELEKLPAARAKAAWIVANSHGEVAATEVASRMWILAKPGRLDQANLLLSVSPYHPAARATLIELAWDKVKDKIGDWEAQSDDNPSILAALAKRSFDAKNYDDVRRLLNLYIKHSPDHWSYQMLANSYKAQGDMDRWRETLDDFLNNVEDLGLSHAQVRVAIAQYFMNRKEWDKAMPYAEAAGESWAEWAMGCAARCAEGARQWEKAETWHMRNAERYTETSFPEWYFFCKRTGHGNLAAARETTEQYIHSLANNPSGRDNLKGCFYWLDGQHEKARLSFTKACKPSIDSASGLCLAVLLDQTGDAAARNDSIGQILKANQNQFPQLIDAVGYVSDNLLDPGAVKKQFDPAELERRLNACAEDQRAFAEFFIAGFLEHHGHVELAKKLYERCADSRGLWVSYKYIAKEAVKLMKDAPSR